MPRGLIYNLLPFKSVQGKCHEIIGSEISEQKDSTFASAFRGHEQIPPAAAGG
jgi:hypothetical protein